MRILSGFLIGFVLVAGLAFAKEPDPIASIRSLYARINNLVDRKKTLVVKLVAFDDGKPAIPTEKEPDGYDTYEQVTAYWHEGRIVRLDRELGSGDQIIHQQYYMYENGATAFLYEKLATFHVACDESEKTPSVPRGVGVFESRIYFGPNGDTMKELKQGFWSETKEPVGKECSHLDPKVAVQKTLSAFPFYNILLANAPQTQKEIGR